MEKCNIDKKKFVIFVEKMVFVRLVLLVVVGIGIVKRLWSYIAKIRDLLLTKII